MITTYRYDPELKKCVEVRRAVGSRVHIIQPDITPFVSPVDGSVINSRRDLEEHNRRNNVTNAADFKEHWEKSAKKREAFYQGKSEEDRKARIEALVHAYDKHNRR